MDVMKRKQPTTRGIIRAAQNSVLLSRRGVVSARSFAMGRIVSPRPSLGNSGCLAGRALPCVSVGEPFQARQGVGMTALWMTPDVCPGTTRDENVKGRPGGSPEMAFAGTTEGRGVFRENCVGQDIQGDGMRVRVSSGRPHRAAPTTLMSDLLTSHLSRCNASGMWAWGGHTGRPAGSPLRVGPFACAGISGWTGGRFLTYNVHRCK